MRDVRSAVNHKLLARVDREQGLVELKPRGAHGVEVVDVGNSPDRIITLTYRFNTVSDARRFVQSLRRRVTVQTDVAQSANDVTVTGPAREVTEEARHTMVATGVMPVMTI